MRGPRPERIIGRYSSLRLQVDPTDPPPTRDARWVALVLGACCLTVGVFLLAVDGIVDAATGSSGFPCSGGPGFSSCSVLNDVLVLPGVALLAIGGIALAGAFIDLF
jgi:hypothetical protein